MLVVQVNMRCVLPVTVVSAVLVISLSASGKPTKAQLKTSSAFAVVVHIATTAPEGLLEDIGELLAEANSHFAQAGVSFELESTETLPESFAVLETARERHKLKKFFKARRINVFMVDTILDPNPSGATKKAAMWQRRKPSGRLAGAHIPAKKKTPDTYIIIKRKSSLVSLTHELGHFFGLPHHKDPGNIMSYGSSRDSFEERQIKIIERRARKCRRQKKVLLIRSSCEEYTNP